MRIKEHAVEVDIGVPMGAGLVGGVLVGEVGEREPRRDGGRLLLKGRRAEQPAEEVREHELRAKPEYL